MMTVNCDSTVSDVHTNNALTCISSRRELIKLLNTYKEPGGQSAVCKSYHVCFVTDVIRGVTVEVPCRKNREVIRR